MDSHEETENDFGEIPFPAWLMVLAVGIFVACFTVLMLFSLGI